jgi:hypothetical protein
VALNLALAAVIGIRDRLTPVPTHLEHVTARYSAEALDEVYPDIDRHERELMLKEVWKPPFMYSDFNHFRVHPQVGKYVNVAEPGFRQSTNQGPWPPTSDNLNVFTFGGSTTYGIGMPDWQTVPSFIQESLSKHCKKRVCVYNFGVGFYYSTQERICLEKLLMNGFVPDIAIFIDGINEGTHWENRPEYSHEMGVIFDASFGSGNLLAGESSVRRPALEILHRLPIGRAARYVKRHFAPIEDNVPNLQNWQGERSSKRVCETYFTNKFLIEQLSRSFDVTPIFVWQPSPSYNYDLKYHLFAPPTSDPPETKYHFAIMREYYPMMRNLHDQRAEDNFLWCADLQKDETKCLYCDRYHYTAAFAEGLADYICQLGIERRLLDRHLD